ncbi:hypothetical protein ACU8KH_01361 [Lachancea thermotolerans]
MSRCDVRFAKLKQPLGMEVLAKRVCDNFVNLKSQPSSWRLINLGSVTHPFENWLRFAYKNRRGKTCNIELEILVLVAVIYCLVESQFNRCSSSPLAAQRPRVAEIKPYIIFDVV